MTIFNSRDENYKSPFGAVCCGAAVSFTVTPGPEFCACALLTFGEFADAHGETALLPCPGGFSGVFTAPEKPELVWYSFRFTRPDGSCVYLGHNGLGEQTSRQPWQLTVYESRPTPEWFGRGVTYQIFPDRFCRDAIPDPKGLLGQRTVHDNWDDPPRLGPDPLTGRWNSDFFGGSLRGICRKLDYLQSLSVTTLYLNPIFYAASSHRYDTADYRMIDPMLGTEGDLRMLCAEAKKRGIHVMLDGVFNHTGDDSRYFNRGGFFDTPGAYQSKESPWYDWFCFQHWPDKYDAWWGIDTLPAVNENAPAYRDFIIRVQDSVIRRWLRCGADGWRLDVADELPDDFIEEIRAAMEQEKPDSFLLGEVWEDGSNKIAYSRRRKYLLGWETHGLMNYPLRTAALDGGLPGRHGGAAGELPPCRLLQRSEHSGHPRHAPHPDAAGRGYDSGQQGGSRRLSPVAGSPAAGRPPSNAGGHAAVYLPRLPHPLLRGRGGHGGLRGSHEPAGLPLGTGGSAAADAVPDAGQAAEGAGIPAIRRPHLSDGGGRTAALLPDSGRRTHLYGAEHR